MTGLRFVRATALSLILLAFAASSASGSTDAHTTLISGAGDAYMKVIISSDGNVWYFEAPSGKSHISTAKWFVAFEGYVLCSSAGTSWDAGSTESGWGQSTISQLNGPNTVPLTITRTTSNRKLQLKQLFTRDAAEQELKIEMTVKNVSSSSLTNVKLNRYFDGDSNVDAEDIYFTTRRSVIEGKQGPDISAGLVMMCLTPPPIGIARAVLFGDWNPFNMNGQGRGCAPSGAIGLIAPFLDWVGVFDANLGPMNAGSSKTVTVVYKRIP